VGQAMQAIRTQTQTRGGMPLPRLSLYVRVVGLNAAMVATAAALLALTPVTVSFPPLAGELLVLAAGVAVLVAANAVLLRRSFRGLDDLAHQMNMFDVLQPQHRLRLVGAPETRALTEAFNRMLERLESERRLSTQRTLSALEGERRRMSRELHDEIGQRLTGILLQLARVAAEAPEDVRPRITATQDEVRAALDEVGTLAWQLRPGILDDLGLPSALGAVVEGLDEHADTAIRMDLPDRLEPLPPDVELAVYRIAQEGVSNALRHAGARRIDLRLLQAGEGLLLEIVDDGRGLAPGDAEGPGIRGMRERALSIGARLDIESAAGTGVTVRLVVPLRQLEE
jgi:two-component system sensor histidine kinase UhpB